jgi:uncharacterized membrane-anchored protein YjiN (DUF445 family)
VLLDRALALAGDWLEANRETVQERLSQGSRYTPRFVDEFLAGRFVASIADLIREVAADPGHAWRHRLDEWVLEGVARLRNDDALRRQVREQALEVIERQRGSGVFDRIWPAVKDRLAADAAADAPELQRVIADGLVVLAEAVLTDAATRDRLNAWAFAALEAAVRSHRHEVARLIADVVARWDAGEVSARIESQIGDDLQYIRINGTLVGGIVGLVLHALPI